MGEIKSTLDLVMERTRNLSMTEEEKKEQREKDAQKKISGCIQKYADGLIKKDEFKTEINRLSDAMGMDCERIALFQVADMITLGRDNLKFFDILENVFKKDITALINVIEGFGEKLREAAQQRSAVILDDLRETHGISGTAVIPNLVRDTGFQKEISAMHAQTNTEISNLIKSL